MAFDSLEKMAEDAIPPMPKGFDRKVHDRLNTSLLTGQLVEYGVRAIPSVSNELSQAVIALIRFSFTGRYPDEEIRKPRSAK